MKNVIRWFCVAWIAYGSIGVAVVDAWAADLVDPAEVGLSQERLEALSARLQAGVVAGDLPGAVMLVARHGKVAWLDALGQRDATADVAMTTDSIFRIYSMTKPIVSVAVMMLHERGDLLISDPVSRYLPEFKSMTVGVETYDVSMGRTDFDIEVAAHPITIQDLLRHTSGITYGVFGDSEVKKRYRDAKTLDWGQTSAEMVAKLGKLPLTHQPGTVWEYGQSTDVLARLIEVVSGQSVDAFLHDNIIAPLGMVDSAYWVPAGDIARVAQPLPGRTALHQVAEKPTWLPGGHGLAGTAMDYFRFAEMTRQGGALDGTRLLSPQTVRFMTSDHLDASISRDGMYLPGKGVGFGLGFAVRNSDGDAHWTGNAGTYYWSGYGGTTFWVDPQEGLVAVFMSQSVEGRDRYRLLVRNMVYAALMD